MKLSLETLASWVWTTFITDDPPPAPESEAEFLGALSSSSHRRSELRRGIEQGASDRIAQLSCWPAADRKKIDDALSAKGLPSLLQMEVLLKKRHTLVLTRGFIRDDEEYFLVKAVTDGQPSAIALGLSEDEQQRLWQFREAYDHREK